PALAVLVPLEEREVGDPEELVAARVDQAELATQVVANCRQHACHGERLVGAEEHRRPRLLGPHRLAQLPGEEPCGRPADPAPPPSSNPRYARPFPPHSFASSSSEASSARENSCGTVRYWTLGACAKTLNSEPRVSSVRSWSSRPKRRSGLSEPKRAIASCQVS